MQTATASDSRPSAWTRFWRRLAEIEDDISRGYDGLHEQRIDYLEAERPRAGAPAAASNEELGCLHQSVCDVLPVIAARLTVTKNCLSSRSSARWRGGETRAGPRKRDGTSPRVSPP